jgi:hypothetical protein
MPYNRSAYVRWQLSPPWYGFYSSPKWLFRLFCRTHANDLIYRRSPSPPRQTAPSPPIKSHSHSPLPQTTPRIRYRPRMGSLSIRPTSTQTPPYSHDLPRLPRPRHRIRANIVTSKDCNAVSRYRFIAILGAGSKARSARIRYLRQENGKSEEYPEGPCS